MAGYGIPVPVVGYCSGGCVCTRVYHEFMVQSRDRRLESSGTARIKCVP